MLSKRFAAPRDFHGAIQQRRLKLEHRCSWSKPCARDAGRVVVQIATKMNALSEGYKFCVTQDTYNPRMSRDKERPNDGVATAAAGALRALRVLIVEDDQDNMRSLMLLLRSEACDVLGVATAKAMWDKAGDFDADVILLDISLPDASGYQVARDLRRTFGEDAMRPVLVAVTAWNKGSDKILAQIAGFDYHLGKPYDPNALLRVLRSVSPEARTPRS